MADPVNTGNSTPGPATGNASQATRANLDQARSHLNKAASSAGESLRGASRAAREELRHGTENVRSELGELAASGRAAAMDARSMADEKLHDVMDQGRDLLASAERMVREKPLQAVGIAALAGFIIAKLR